MDFSSLVTSLVTSLIIFLILMLVFVYLSRKPTNAVIYYPNRILKGTTTPEDASGTSRSIFAWLREAVYSTEDDVIAASGVDSAVYFVFLSTVLGIFVLSGIVLLPILIPLAATDSAIRNIQKTNSSGNFSDLDKISMGNIKEKSDRLWGYACAVFWVSIMTYAFLWKAYNHVAALRARVLACSATKPEQFAVVVRDIPPPEKGMTLKESVDSFFRSIFPTSFYRSMIVTDMKETCKLFDKIEALKKKLARAEAVYSQSGSRPKHRTGSLGLIGKKVDSIEFYTDEIETISVKLEAEQKVTLRDKQQQAAIVFFTDRISAVCAGQSLPSPVSNHWTVMEAPEPRQVLWVNLGIPFFNRQLRQNLIYAFVAAIIMFYMIPITFVSAFTTLENITKYLKFTKSILKYTALKTFLEAFIPQLALIIFLALLPSLLLFLSKKEGIVSEGHAVRATSGKYFYFTVFNVFLGVTIGGSLLQSAKDIVDKPTSIVDKLASSLPSSAGFFLTFVALKFFVGYGLELSRLVPLIIFKLKERFLCKTEEEVRDAWRPGDLGYHTRVPNDMLIVTIVLCYSVISPLILPFGALYFAIGWVVLRNQALRVYVPSYETYGRMWPHLFKRVMASLVLFQLTMLGYFGLKKFYYAGILVVPLVASGVFVYVCKNKFYQGFASTAMDVVVGKEEGGNMEEVFKAFVPPCLKTQKEDELFEDALSETSKTGSV